MSPLEPRRDPNQQALADYVASFFGPDTGFLEDEPEKNMPPHEEVTSSQKNREQSQPKAAKAGGDKPASVKAAESHIASGGLPLRANLSSQVSTTRPLQIHADGIPADIPLSSTQKKELQKLLDTSVALPPLIDQRPGATSDSPETETPEFIEHQTAQVEDNLSVEPNFRAHWAETPDWAEKGFDALLFSCRGVTLAIPLIHLGHIYLQAEPLKQLPGLPLWGLGVKPLAQGQLKVIDAGAYFMPERAGELQDTDDYPIISIAGSQWAFAVDSVANPVAITEKDVQWRSLNKENPWLAGAIKQYVCVLIDPPALVVQLEEKSS